MELNLVRGHSYDRGALADSFTPLRIEPTTSEVRVTYFNHCATCSYSLDNWVWIFLIDYLVEKKFLTRHLAIRGFWQLITALRYSGAMVRASAFHVLACRFSPRYCESYCESVHQCSSMVTVLPGQVELHPSQFSLGQSCRQGCWGHTRVWGPVTKCKVQLRIGYHIPFSWERVPFMDFRADLSRCLVFHNLVSFCKKVFLQTPESKIQVLYYKFFNAKLKLKSCTARVADS